ncbi:uncharacterized protein LOC110962796 isoform X2 [Acanthochromis polyacanthus]|uniref:uncharacterized protein LOC110962796 isoform X2 n=1 Tax=Acanthochromis polyacanthus TaxID=80966 RepID=UPI0022348C65|nr:uncharacterized protein LOC110962796 isoform X2 [Acanthochromis polyacanthus]
MSRRKCFFGCEGKLNLFASPKEESTRQYWIQFLFAGQQPTVNWFLCSRHFSEDAFLNRAQYEAGFSARLLLRDGAVPSVKGRVKESEALASSSQQTPTTRYRHIGGQTDPLPTVSVATQFCHQMVSVGTQLSYSTLKNHVRSKAVQVSICNTAGTETSQQDTRFKLSSTPGKASAPSLGVRPAKRPRLELQEDEEDEGNLSENAQPHDSTYDLDDSPSEMRGMESTCDYTDPKYIVFESCLRDLFQTCPVCRWECVVQQRSLGTFVSFSQRCPNCQYTRKWQSQPIKGNTPVGNLQMSAAVYFTGASFIQMEKICKAMNLQMFHYDTFRRHARMFLEPAINHKWKTDQQTLVERLKEKDKIAVGGDMRADSAGPSPKFSSYALMHLDSNNIIDVQLVQSNEVGGSSNMETEGLRRGLDFLEAHHLDVDYIVTDRHAQVEKHLKERNVEQYYDVWHLEKDLSQQLENLAKNKECLVVRKWLPSIKNHIYWTATASKSGPEKVAKWKSLVNHLQNVHKHEDPLFPRCTHPDRVSRDPNKWFQPGSLALNKVEKLLLDKQILHDVEKLSHDHQISSLEAFHSTTERFTPKNDVLSFIGRLCRLYLAAMHFNENGKRDQSTSLEGKAVYKIMFPNCSNGQYITNPNQTAPTFQYVSDLMKLLFKKIFEDPTRYIEDLNEISIPEDRWTQFERPS